MAATPELSARGLPQVAYRRLFTGDWLPLTIRTMRVALALIVSVLFLSACGYKGPLTLPKPKPGAQQPAPAPAQQKDEKK